MIELRLLFETRIAALLLLLASSANAFIVLSPNFTSLAYREKVVVHVEADCKNVDFIPADAFRLDDDATSGLLSDANSKADILELLSLGVEYGEKRAKSVYYDRKVVKNEIMYQSNDDIMSQIAKKHQEIVGLRTAKFVDCLNDFACDKFNAKRVIETSTYRLSFNFLADSGSNGVFSCSHPSGSTRAVLTILTQPTIVHISQPDIYYEGTDDTVSCVFVASPDEPFTYEFVYSLMYSQENEITSLIQKYSSIRAQAMTSSVNKFHLTLNLKEIQFNFYQLPITCRAVSRFGQVVVAADLLLNVNFRPKNIIAVQERFADDWFKISCSALSYPPAKFYWESYAFNPLSNSYLGRAHSINASFIFVNAEQLASPRSFIHVCKVYNDAFPNETNCSNFLPLQANLSYLCSHSLNTDVSALLEIHAAYVEKPLETLRSDVFLSALIVVGSISLLFLLLLCMSTSWKKCKRSFNQHRMLSAASKRLIVANQANGGGGLPVGDSQGRGGADEMPMTEECFTVSMNCGRPHNEGQLIERLSLSYTEDFIDDYEQCPLEMSRKSQFSNRTQGTNTSFVSVNAVAVATPVQSPVERGVEGSDMRRDVSMSENDLPLVDSDSAAKQPSSKTSSSRVLKCFSADIFSISRRMTRSLSWFGFILLLQLFQPTPIGWWFIILSL